MLQFQWPPPDVTLWGSEMDKFEQVSNDHHHMSLAGGPGLMSGGNGGQGGWGPRSDVHGRLGPGGRGLYSEIQCFMDNSHMGPPPMDGMRYRHD